jgi:hypothetical protein
VGSVNVYTYTVAIKAPNEFTAAAFIGQLHEAASQWRRLDTTIHIVSIDVDNSDLTHDYDVGDDPPAIDTIPLF